MCCTQHTVEHPCFQGVPPQGCHRERGLPQLKIKTKHAIGFYSGLKSHIFIIFFLLLLLQCKKASSNDYCTFVIGSTGTRVYLMEFRNDFGHYKTFVYFIL